MPPPPLPQGPPPIPSGPRLRRLSNSRQDPPQSNLVWIFVGASLLLHIVLLLLIFSGLFSRLRIPDLKEKPTRIVLTLVPKPLPPPAPAPVATPFLDTTALPTVETPDPRAAFEGETNTAATSRTPGQGNPALPNQQGEPRSGMEFYNSTYSPEQPTPLSPPPVPQTTPQPATPSEPVEESASKQAVKENFRTHSSARIQTGEPEKEPKEKPNETPKTETAQNPSPATPQQKTEPTTPPTSFSAYKRENRIEGGASRGEVNSASARESEIGRYKARLYRAIGSRWYAYIHQDTGTISLGVVRLRFFVRNDGVILLPEVIDGKQHAALLAVSRRSVMEVSGQLEPFSENMRQQLGEGYYEEVSFSIY